MPSPRIVLYWSLFYFFVYTMCLVLVVEPSFLPSTAEHQGEIASKVSKKSFEGPVGFPARMLSYQAEEWVDATRSALLLDQPR